MRKMLAIVFFIALAIYSEKFANAEQGFDYLAYLSANPDLPSYWGKAECVNHYKLFGFWENRAAAFNLEEYLYANPDLPGSWTLSDALNHYNMYGKFENRLLAFNAQEYLSLYSDLPQTWSYDQAYAHYNNYGRYEGRIASFDEVAYSELYSDLPESWNQEEAFSHYIYYGQPENRVYDPYDESLFAVPYTPLPDFSSLQDMIDDFAVNDIAIIIGNEEGVLYRYEKGNFTVDTRIRIASANKWLTGAAVWTLIEKGVISSDDNPQDYIDFWVAEPSDLRSTITFDNLFGLQSGFNNSPIQAECIGSPNYTLYECVESLYSGGLDSDPGEAFYYGPEHFQIAALISSEALSGKDFRQIMRDEVFDPAGMSSATGYLEGTGDNTRYSGSIFSTAMDYGKFLRALLAGDLINDLDGFLADRTQNIPFGFRPDTVESLSLDWHYAFGFWKECDAPEYESACNEKPVVSSPGAFGFTPWIDFSRGYWGVIAFEGGDDAHFRSGMESVNLEQQIQDKIDYLLDSN